MLASVSTGEQHVLQSSSEAIYQLWSLECLFHPQWYGFQYFGTRCLILPILPCAILDTGLFDAQTVKLTLQGEIVDYKYTTSVITRQVTSQGQRLCMIRWSDADKACCSLRKRSWKFWTTDLRLSWMWCLDGLTQCVSLTTVPGTDKACTRAVIRLSIAEDGRDVA